MLSSFPRIHDSNYHAIHRLRNSKTVIAKLVDRQDAIKILRNKKKLRELPRSGKQKLRATKIILTSPCVPITSGYLASAMRCSKRSKLNTFFTVNGNTKIKYDSEDGERKTEISHAEDLVDIFRTEIMQEIDAERNNR